MIVVAILIAAIGAFGSAYTAPFEFDDVPAIAHNATIRGLWAPNRPWAPPGLGSPVSGRPVANVSLALDYAVNRALGVPQVPDSDGDEQTVVYHMTNILIHVGVALVLFGIVRRIIGEGQGAEDLRDAATPVAFAVALLWAVHPMQTEAVDYLSQRTEILAALFMLGAVYASMRRWTAVAVASCALGMGTKETALVTPLLIVLIDRAFFFPSVKAVWHARRGLYVGLLATYAWSAYLIFGGGRTTTVGFGLGIGAWSYLRSQGWAISHYLGNVFFPIGLTYDYGFEPIDGWRAAAGLAALLVLGLAGVWLWRGARLRWLGFLIVAFFLLLAPSSSVVPIQTEIAADRRMYLPLACVVVATVVSAALIIRRSPSKRRPMSASAGVLALLALLEIAMSAHRSAMYTRPESLWRDAVAKVPGNPRALNGLARAELRDRPTASREPDSLLSVALSLDSTYIPALLTKSALATRTDRLGDAAALLERVLRLSPTDSAAHDDIGQVLLADGKPDRALPYLKYMARWSPTDRNWTSLGIAYLMTRQPDSAAIALEQALTHNPDNPQALEALGTAYMSVGRFDDAERVLRRALAIAPGFERVQQDLQLLRDRKR